jgi:hypothetical protein
LLEKYGQIKCEIGLLQNSNNVADLRKDGGKRYVVKYAI